MVFESSPASQARRGGLGHLNSKFLSALLNLRSVSKASDNSGDFGSFLIHVIFDVDKFEKADNFHRNLGVVKRSHL